MSRQHSIPRILLVFSILLALGVIGQKFTSFGNFTVGLVGALILGYLYRLGIIFHSFSFPIQKNSNDMLVKLRNALTITDAKELPNLHFWITPNSSSFLFAVAMYCFWFWLAISFFIDTLLRIAGNYFLLIFSTIFLIVWSMVLFFINRKNPNSLNLTQQEYMALTPNYLQFYYKGDDKKLAWHEIRDMYFLGNVNPPRFVCTTTIQEDKEFPIFSINLLDIKFKKSATIMDKILTHYWQLNKQSFIK